MELREELGPFFGRRIRELRGQWLLLASLILQRLPQDLTLGFHCLRAIRIALTILSLYINHLDILSWLFCQMNFYL